MQQTQNKIFADFSKQERAVLNKLNSPEKIQDFLDTLPINFEENGNTDLSPREVMRRRTAHCAEAAIFAAAALWYHGRKPLLMDLVTVPRDWDHVVALYREHGRWGAISKTNHAVLRYREPVYQTVRELALSYFHEYTDDCGRKTLRSYSAPFDLSRYKDTGWLTSEDNLWDIIIDLDDSKHFPILTPAQARRLRAADPIEIQAGRLIEWPPPQGKQP